MGRDGDGMGRALGAWQPWGGTISLSNARIGSMHGIGRHEDLTVLYLDNNRCVSPSPPQAGGPATSQQIESPADPRRNRL